MSGLLLLIASCLLSSVTAFSTGAGEDACKNIMTPLHSNTERVRDRPSPYRIQVDVSKHLGTFFGGENVTVTLSVKDEQADPFRGFIVAAVGENPKEGEFHVGEFVVNPEDRKYVQTRCGHTSLTHTIDWAESPRSHLTLTWKAPSRVFSGTVTFHATFVQNFSTYWVNELGDNALGIAYELPAHYIPPQQEEVNTDFENYEPFIPDFNFYEPSTPLSSETNSASQQAVDPETTEPMGNQDTTSHHGAQTEGTEQLVTDVAPSTPPVDQIEAHEPTQPPVNQPEVEVYEPTQPLADQPEVETYEPTQPQVGQPEVEVYEPTQPLVDQPEVEAHEATQPTTSVTEPENPPQSSPLARSRAANTMAADKTTAPSKRQGADECIRGDMRCLKRKLVSGIHDLILSLEQIQQYISPTAAGSTSSRL